jgi:hypothetical protein
LAGDDGLLFSSFRGARKREPGISQGNIQIPGLRLWGIHDVQLHIGE